MLLDFRESCLPKKASMGDLVGDAANLGKGFRILFDACMGDGAFATVVRRLAGDIVIDCCLSNKTI